MPQQPPRTICNSSPNRPSPREVVHIPDAVRTRCGYSPLQRQFKRVLSVSHSCFNFHFGRGRTHSPLPPSLQITLGSGVWEPFFMWANFFLPRLRRTCSRVLWSFHSIISSLCCRYHVAASHRYILWHLVQPCPRAKRSDIALRPSIFAFKIDGVGEKARGIQCRKHVPHFF